MNNSILDFGYRYQLHLHYGEGDGYYVDHDYDRDEATKQAAIDKAHRILDRNADLHHIEILDGMRPKDAAIIIQRNKFSARHYTTTTLDKEGNKIITKSTVERDIEGLN